MTMRISSAKTREVQSFTYDRKREKREREQAARDAEYHENRMKLLEK